MTEAEWLSCPDPNPMLYHLCERKDCDRRIRLFMIVCCRFVWRVTAKRVRSAVKDIVTTAERYADGQATEEDLRAAVAAGPGPDWDATSPFVSTGRFEDLAIVAMYSSGEAAEIAAFADAYPSDDRGDPAWLAAYAAERAIQAGVLRDIFGNPFRPVSLEPAWLTPDVVALARTIYDEWEFDRMPLLGDALEGAGCDDPDILAHCRSQAEHVRGCWVVDAILGKS